MSGIQQNGDGSEETQTKWEGYSDYRRVSGQVAASIDEALDAYAAIDSAHAENARVSADDAAEARQKILGAALKLAPELENDREVEKQYASILNRWQGEDGFLQRLDSISLRETSPAWLRQFVLDIRTAGWELGYLQAGRTQRAEPEDPVERDVQSMFKE